MRQFLLGLALLVSSQQAFSYTQDVAVAISKKYAEIALWDSYHFLYSCLTNPDECGLTQNERKLADMIYKARIFDRVKSKLEYVSEREQPGFFQLDGAVRIAKTGRFHGSEIYLNKDMLALPADPDNEAAGYVPVSFEKLLAVVIHELGHHHELFFTPNLEHEELDIFALKIADEMRRYSQSETFRAGETSITYGQYVSIGTRNQNQENAVLLLTSDFGVVELSDVAKRFLTCPKVYYRGELETESTPFGMHLQEFTANLRTIDANTFSLDFAINKAAVKCIANDNRSYDTYAGYKNGKLSIPLRIGGDKKLVVDDAAITFTMTTPPDQHWN